MKLKISFIKNLLTVIICTTSFFLSFGQNILNGGFEQGTLSNNYNQLDHATGWETGCAYNYGAGNIGSPDLYDCSNGSTNSMDTPANNILDPRPTSGNCRFAGMLGPIYSSNQLNRRESIKTTTGIWTDQYVYTLSFYVARAYESSFSPSIIHMEAVLRSTGDCNQEKVIDFTTDITINNYSWGDDNWTLVTSTFFLNAQESAMGFDQLEIRPKFENVNIPEKVYVDDVSLTKELRPVAVLEATNYLDVIQMPSPYGPQNVYRFCEDDPIIMNGSLSSNETDYIFEIYEFDFQQWSFSPLLYNSGWINGTAPSSIDIASYGPYDPNKVYMMSLGVGGVFNSDLLFFTVVECCPDELIIVPDCENGTLSITNIPQGATNVSISWYYDSGINSVPLKPNTSTINASQGAGKYTATVSFTMSNGIECNIWGSILYSEESCCEINGPTIDEGYGVTHTNTVTVQTNPWGTQEIPVVDCNFKLNARTSCEDYWYLSIEPFDPISWQVIPGPSFSNCYSGSFPNPSNIPALTGYSFASGYYLITFGVDDDPCAVPLADVRHIVVRYDCQLRDTKKRATEPNAGDFDFNVQPNPSNNYTEIQFESNQSGKIQIVSMDGKEMKSITFEDVLSVEIDVHELPSGIYFIQVNNDSQTISKKFIKN